MIAIRHDMAALGFDLSDYTDEDLQAGMLRFGEVIQAAQFTMQEVVSACAILAHAIDASKG